MLGGVEISLAVSDPYLPLAVVTEYPPPGIRLLRVAYSYDIMSTRHPHNRKYITYRNTATAEPSHEIGNMQTGQLISLLLSVVLRICLWAGLHTCSSQYILLSGRRIELLTRLLTDVVKYDLWCKLRYGSLSVVNVV